MLRRRRRTSRSEREEAPLSYAAPPPSRRRSRAGVMRRCRAPLSRAFSLRRVGIATIFLTALGLGAVGVRAGVQAVKSRQTRNLSVCVVTDASFRVARPNWADQFPRWFTEVNRSFAPAGVQFTVQTGGDAYPEDTPGDLSQRRASISENPGCPATDVVLGFTGRSDSDVDSAVYPFGHVLLVAPADTDSDAASATTLARSLATLFAVPAGAALDPASLELVSSLRNYDFAKGIAALPGSWERRAAKSLEAWYAARTKNPAAEAHRAVANAYAAANDHAHAIAQLREAVRLAPSNAELRIELASELRAEGAVDEALRELSDAVRLAPEDARSHEALGAFLFDRKQMESAVEELQAATRLNPNEAAYHTLLGRALSTQLGRTHEAVAAFEAALQRRPGDHEASRGLSLATNAATVLEAEVTQRDAEVRDAPQDSQARLRLGVALAEAGKIPASLAAIQKSIELDPRNGLAHVAMARLKYAAADYAAARQEIDSAKAVGVMPFAAFEQAVERRLK